MLRFGILLAAAFVPSVAIGQETSQDIQMGMPELSVTNRSFDVPLRPISSQITELRHQVTLLREAMEKQAQYIEALETRVKALNGGKL